MRQILPFIFMVTLILAGNSWQVKSAFAQEESQLTDEQQALVSQAVEYLNTITTLKARFHQETSRGDYAEGEVLLDRPGKARFEYDPPSPVLLIANDFNLLYYEKDLKQATFIPVYQTPLWFFLRKTIRIDSDLEILGVRDYTENFEISLAEKQSPEKGSIKIFFSKNPLTLQHWEITDAQEVTTRVSLVNPEFGVEIEDGMFNQREGYVEFEQKQNNR